MYTKLVSLLCLVVLLHVSLSLNFGSLFKSRARSLVEQSLIKDQLKKDIRQLSRNRSNGITAPLSVKNQIIENAVKLEKLNPTKQISTSCLLDGSWKLDFTSNEGSSAGKLGPFVGEVDQIIDLGSESYKNIVTIGPLKASLTAVWDVLEKKAWKVKFQKLDVSLFGIKVKTIPFVNAEGVWRYVYLDDDMRILYAEGASTAKAGGNIYILSKK